VRGSVSPNRQYWRCFGPEVLRDRLRRRSDPEAHTQQLSELRAVMVAQQIDREDHGTNKLVNGSNKALKTAFFVRTAT
jgi:hypothetical protein